jgi:hypothetical protein
MLKLLKENPYQPQQTSQSLDAFFHTPYDISFPEEQLSLLLSVTVGLFE